MTNTPRPPLGYDESNGFAPERLRMGGGTHDLSAENAKLQARVAELEAEVRTMTTAGIIEVAVRNPSVMEYTRHWEDRAQRADAALATAEMNCRSYKAMADAAIHRMDAAQARAEHADAEAAKIDALMAAGFAEYERRLEQAEAEAKRLRPLAINIVASYPAERHGSLPLDPHKAAAQVRDELVATLTRALREGGKDNPMRCAECNCFGGGTDCNWIKSDTAQKGGAT